MRFSRLLVESVEIAQPWSISGTSWRRNAEISLPIAWLLLALQTQETEVEGGRRVPGSGPFGCICVGRLLAAKIVPASVGWSGGAKVSCILCHRGVQLILAYSWVRSAILVAG